jgi:hypothetical protein
MALVHPVLIRWLTHLAQGMNPQVGTMELLGSKWLKQPKPLEMHLTYPHQVYLHTLGLKNLEELPYF